VRYGENPEETQALFSYTFVYSFSRRQRFAVGKCCHYIISAGEYRRELLFFTYLSLNASIGWLDRLRQTGNETSSKNDVFSSLGARLTTGFFFDTRMQLAYNYNYNFNVIRDGHYGEHEIVLHFSRHL
jgi:hypothetical protein